MAKRGYKKSSKSSGRVISNNANWKLQPTVSKKIIDATLDIEKSRRALVRSLEDRRRWHPVGDYRPAESLKRDSRRLEPAQSRYQQRQRPAGGGYAKYLPRVRNVAVNVGFKEPRDVAVCVRRQTRREVLHAFAKTGGRGGRQRRPRYNWQSRISCRRKK